jgi:hypothetical protein
MIAFSTRAKIGAGIIGVLSGGAWVYSALQSGQAASTPNSVAAFASAAAMILQAISALVDARYPPYSSWS